MGDMHTQLSTLARIGKFYLGLLSLCMSYTITHSTVTFTHIAPGLLSLLGLLRSTYSASSRASRSSQ